MPNALQAEGTIVDNGASLMILKDGRSLPDDLSIAREGKVYLGSECPIVNKESPQLKYFEITVFESQRDDEIIHIGRLNKG